MRSVPRVVMLLLVSSVMLAPSCMMPLPCPCGPTIHQPTRPGNIARPPDLVLLTHNPMFETVARNMHPSWSRNGHELVFERVSYSSEGDSGLCVIQVDGSQPTILWPIEHTTEPAWAPNGDWIACRVDSKDGLMLLHRDGQRSQYLGKRFGNASWSPDGQRLVCENALVYTNHYFYFVDWLKGSEQSLLIGPGDNRDPAWSPDGHRIAFSSNRDGAYNIYIMPVPETQDQVEVDNSQIIQLTYATGDPQKGMIQPTWSPDGKQIAFVCNSGLSTLSKEGNLYVVDAAGGEPTLLLDTKWCYDPAWSPDGSWLAFSYGARSPTGLLGSDIFLLRMKR